MSNHHKIQNSSSISHIDYHDDKETLEICFINGGVYHYPNCPKKHYEALKTAASAGKHFQSHIIKNFKGIKQ